MGPEPFPDLTDDFRIMRAFDGAQELGGGSLEAGEPRYLAPARHHIFEESSDQHLGFFQADRIDLGIALRAMREVTLPLTIYTLYNDRVMSLSRFDGKTVSPPLWKRRPWE